MDLKDLPPVREPVREAEEAFFLSLIDVACIRFTKSRVRQLILEKFPEMLVPTAIAYTPTVSDVMDVFKECPQKITVIDNIYNDCEDTFLAWMKERTTFISREDAVDYVRLDVTEESDTTVSIVIKER